MSGEPIVDQAANLRRKIDEAKFSKMSDLSPPIISIASGKGGVGKSHVAINLAWQMAASGKKILLFDADYGLGNTDILLGVNPKYHLGDAIENRQSVTSLLCPLNENLDLIASGSGMTNLANAAVSEIEGLLLEMEILAKQYDYVILDTGSGIGQMNIATLGFSDEVVIVLTPDPTSLTDSYATIKLAHQNDARKKFKVIVNMANSLDEGQNAFENLNFVTKKYLNLSLRHIGLLKRDAKVVRAIRRQKVFCSEFSGCESELQFSKIASRIMREPMPNKKRNIYNFLSVFFKKNMGLKSQAVAV